MVLLAGILFSGLLVPTGEAVSAGAENWGLSFQEEGKTPVGNASDEYLRQYDACYAGDPLGKKIYLTFDAGYENGCTPAILDALKKHSVKAAFFVVGNYIETCPDLVKRMVEEGHLVGNHTYHHPDMSSIADKAAFQEELSSLESLYQETTGQEMPKYYRPPQGKFSESNLRQAKELGYRTVFWSLAYVDWYQDQQPSRQGGPWINSLAVSIPALWCCSTALPLPTRRFWMNCSLAGRTWAIPLAPCRSCLRRRIPKKEK